MPAAAAVLISTAGRVTTVTINRPEVRNAVDRPTAEALTEAFLAFDADDEADVAVLAGAGGTFCAGADLGAISSGRGNRTEPDGSAPMGPSRLFLSKPVVAAVSGYAVAGGLELACWCDLRVVEEDAVFGVFCRRWGVPLIDGGTVRLPRLIGRSRALDLILTGRPVRADEALAIGLANRVVPRGQALEAAQLLAAELTRWPQGTMRGDRRSIYEQEALERPEAMAREFAIGRASLEQAISGAAEFAAGRGRHGRMDGA